MVDIVMFVAGLLYDDEIHEQERVSMRKAMRSEAPSVTPFTPVGGHQP